jgi:Tfp pilus assembly protein PilO
MKAVFQSFLLFTRRNPVMVFSLVVIVLMGTASWFLWQRQQSLTVEHDEIRRNGDDMLQSLTGQTRINAEITTVTDALEFIDHNLINEGDLAENLGYFYKIETASRIRFSQLNQLSSQPQPEGSLYKPVPFTLRASGTYRQILRLVHELETGPRQLRIRTYALSQSDSGPAPAAPGGADAGPPDLVTMEMTVEVLAHP